MRAGLHPRACACSEPDGSCSFAVPPALLQYVESKLLVQGPIPARRWAAVQRRPAQWPRLHAPAGDAAAVGVGGRGVCARGARPWNPRAETASGPEAQRGARRQ